MAEPVVTPWRHPLVEQRPAGLPRAFAWYSAVSASRSTVSGSGPGSPQAGPMLADTLTSRPAMVNDGARASTRRRAIRSAWAGSRTSSADDHELVAAETGHEVVGADGVGEPVGHRGSSSSPVSWPKESLTNLKSSRSTNSTANDAPGSV